MSQSSFGYHDPEEDGADTLPMDTEDRASTNIQSPDFQLPKEEAAPAPAQPFGTPMASAMAGLSLPEAPETPQEPAVAAAEPPQVSASHLPGIEAPEVKQALQQVGQPPAPMAMPKRGYEQNWLDARDRHERDNARQQQGIHHFLRSRGVEMQVMPDGSEQIATHEDGSPRFHPSMSAPYQEEQTGRWLVKQRDERGHLKDADLFSTKGLVHTDPATGNRYVMGPNKKTIDLNSPDPIVVRHNEVKALRSQLYAQENEASYRAQTLHDEVIAPATELVKQLQAAPAIEGNGLDRKSKSMRAVENIVAAYSPSAENGTLGEDQRAELTDALEAVAKFRQNHPEYGPATDTIRGAKAEIARLKSQQAADRHRRITSILHPDASAAMIAGLPDTMASRGEEPSEGSVDPAEVAHDTALAAAQQGTTQSRALVSVLKRYRASGAQTVGEQPIEEAIRAAQNPPKRAPEAVKQEVKAPETAGFLSSAGATIRKVIYDTAALATDAAASMVEKSQDPFGNSPAFLRDNQPRLDAMRKRLAEITSPDARAAGAGVMSDESAALVRRINRLTMNPGWAEAVKNLQQEGAASYDAYDISPEAGNPLAKIGRGAGGFLAIAPTLSVMPLAVAQMAGNAYEAKYAEVENAAPKGADPDEVHDQAQQAAMREAVKQAPQLLAYTVGGKLASAAVGRLMPEAGPLAKALATTTAATAANMAVGAGTRAMEGKPIAPDLETGTMDFLFGAHGGTAGFHSAKELERHVATALAIRDQGTPTAGQNVDPAQQKLAADFLAKQSPRLVAKIEARMQRAQASDTSTTPEDPTLPEGAKEIGLTTPRRESGAASSPEPAETGPGAQAKAFSATLKASDELAPEIAAAGADNAARGPLSEEQGAHQKALHRAQAEAVSEIAPEFRKTIGRVISPEVDVAANEAHFAGDTDAGFQAAHVGRELRDVYTTPEQQSVIEQVKAQAGEHGPMVEFIADQHTGMLAAKDLLDIATGKGEVPTERVAELGRLGLVEPGEDGSPHVAHDALPLLPKGFTGRLLTAHDNYRVKSLHGEKLAGVAAMVRGGQEQLETALHAKAMHVREQATPKPYHVRVEFTNHAGQPREKIVRGSFHTDEQAMAHAMTVAEKRGMKVTHAEVTTPEKEAARRKSGSSDTQTRPPDQPPPESRGSESSPEHSDPLAGRKNVFTKADPKALAPEERGAVRTVIQFLRKNRAALRAMGIDPEPEFGRNTRDSSGLAVTSGGKLLLDGKQLREHFAALGGPEKAAEWVKAAVMEEEGLHRHQFLAAEKAGLDFNEHYAAIREEAPADMVQHARETYEGFDQLAPHEQGAELERMVLQQKWHGSLTERMFKSIERILAYLRGLKIESTLLKESIARVEAVRDEALKQSRDTADAPPPARPASARVGRAAESSPRPNESAASEESSGAREQTRSSPNPASPAAEGKPVELMTPAQAGVVERPSGKVPNAPSNAIRRFGKEGLASASATPEAVARWKAEQKAYRDYHQKAKRSTETSNRYWQAIEAAVKEGRPISAEAKAFRYRDETPAGYEKKGKLYEKALPDEGHIFGKLEAGDTLGASRAWDPKKYPRLMPRDLFNESKVLAMHLKLVDDLSKGRLPVGFEVTIREVNPEIGLAEDGFLHLEGVDVTYNGERVKLEVPYNAGKEQKFPLQATLESADAWSVPVYDEAGNLDKDFGEAFGEPSGTQTPVKAPEEWQNSRNFMTQLGAVGLWEVDGRLSRDFAFDLRAPEKGFMLGGDHEYGAKNLAASLDGKKMEFFTKKGSGELLFRYEGREGRVLAGREMSDDFKKVAGFKPDSLSASKAKSAAQKEAERLAKLREMRAGFAAETAPIQQAPEPHILTKPEGRSVINAYHHLAQKTGFPAVAIADLADQSGIPLDKLKQQLLRSQKAGSVVLSTGDWSLASDKVKSGAIEVPGQRPMLQVRFLQDAGGMAASRVKEKLARAELPRLAEVALARVAAKVEEASQEAEKIRAELNGESSAELRGRISMVSHARDIGESRARLIRERLQEIGVNGPAQREAFKQAVLGSISDHPLPEGYRVRQVDRFHTADLPLGTNPFFNARLAAGGNVERGYSRWHDEADARREVAARTGLAPENVPLLTYKYEAPRFAVFKGDTLSGRAAGTGATEEDARILFHKKQAQKSPESMQAYADKYDVKFSDPSLREKTLREELAQVQRTDAEAAQKITDLHQRRKVVAAIEERVREAEDRAKAMERMGAAAHGALSTPPTTRQQANIARDFVGQLEAAGHLAPEEVLAARAHLDELDARAQADEYLRAVEALPERMRGDRVGAKIMLERRSTAQRIAEKTALWSDLIEKKYGSVVSKLARFWKGVATDDEAFAFPKSTARDPDLIAQQMSIPGHSMTATEKSDSITFHAENGELTITGTSGAKPEIYAASAGSKGKKQGGGAQLYQAALTWAHNNGEKIHPSNALTPINKFVRRTSNMLSSALRFGTTKHMTPDREQGVKWKAGNDSYNVGQLALREMEQVFKAVPELQKLTFDFDTGKVRDEHGTEVTPAGLEQKLREDKESSFDRGIGRSTAQRAIITASALRELERSEAAGDGGGLDGRGARLSDEQGSVLYASKAHADPVAARKEGRAEDDTLPASKALAALHAKISEAMIPARAEMRSAGSKREIAQDYDAGENSANNEGERAGNHIRLDFARPKAADESRGQRKARQAEQTADREAMPYVIESGIKPLADQRADVLASSDPKLIASEIPKIDRAIRDFARLNRLRTNHDRMMAQNHAELKRAGVNVGEVQDYITRKLELPDATKDALPSPLFAMGNGQGSSPRYFTKGRSFATLSEAVKAGYKPQSTDIAKLDAHRIAAGRRIIEQRAFFDKLKATPSPTDGKPIIGELEQRTLANGKTEATVPHGYSTVTAGGRPIVVHNQFADLFRNLFGQSGIRSTILGRALLKIAAAGKHGTLVFDTFHVGRLLYKMASGGGGSPIQMRDGKPVFGYHDGLSLLEYSDGDLSRAQKAGDLTAREVAYARQHRGALNELVKAGLNVGKVSDNLMEQAGLHLPGLQAANKWIFGKLSRGAMVQTALRFYERNLNRAGLTQEQAARRTATEMNEYFGNLQNQGIFKSKALQDMARLVFLAPNWTESQLRYEARAYGQAGASVLDAARGRGLRVGNASRAMAMGFVALLAANQVANYLSRGQSTSQNEEDGHKLDAWVPGGKRGFWFNPFEIAGEYAHAAMKYAAQHENPVDIATHIASNKLSPLGRGVKEAATGRDYSGRHFQSDQDRFRSAVVDSLPSPMPLGGVLEKDPRAPIGYRLTRQPGAFQKQVMQSAGAKVTAAQSPRSQMFALAHDFRPDGQYHDSAGEYTELRRALDNDQADAIKDEMRGLLARGKDMHAIVTALGVRSGGIAPEIFTGSHQREAEMLKSLTPQQKNVYAQAQKDHVENAKKFLAFAHSPEGSAIIGDAKRKAAEAKRAALVH